MGTTELRQNVLLASQKASGKGEIGFDKDLVMTLFHRTLERGIINHARDQAPSQKSSTKHEKLRSAVTKASALEKERSSFQNRNKKEVKCLKYVLILALVLCLRKARLQNSFLRLTNLPQKYHLYSPN